MNKPFADLQKSDYVEIIQKQISMFGYVWAEDSFIKAINHPATNYGHSHIFKEIHLYNHIMTDFDAFGTIIVGQSNEKILLNYVLNTNIEIKGNITFVFRKSIYDAFNSWAALTPELISNPGFISGITSFEKNYPHIPLPDNYKNLLILT